MRRTIWPLTVLALAVTVAVAQPPRKRAVTFKQPQAIQPGELPAVARGAAEAIPPVGYSPSTPNARPTNSSSRPPVGGNGPAWLTGVDPNVLPAAGIASKLGSAPANASPHLNATEGAIIHDRKARANNGTADGCYSISWHKCEWFASVRWPACVPVVRLWQRDTRSESVRPDRPVSEGVR